MKKFFISLGVIGVFVLYSLGIRHKNPIIAKPTSLSQTTTSTSTSSNNNTQPTNSSATKNSPTSNSQYKDGIYTGSIANAYYGNVQVSVTISGGKITNVTFLQYPDTHSTSVEINQQAMPYLQQEAIQAQSANVQILTGATFTSQAFIQSLQSALSHGHS